MVKINAIPKYIFNPRYGFNYVIGMKMNGGSLLYQRACKTIKEANRRMNVLKGWHGDKFEVYFLNEITQ